MRKFFRTAVVVVLLGSWALMPVPAQAALTLTYSSLSGLFTVSGDADDDSVTIVCSGGNMLVNGLVPLGTPIACADVKSLIVAMGAGNDTADLSGVAGAFSGLTSINLIGNAGDDSIFGSQLDETIASGSGDDIVSPGLGGGTFAGGKGSDLLNVPDSTSSILTDSSLDLMGDLSTLASFEYANMQGTSGPDTLDGSGFSGYFNLSAKGGNDVVTGGPADNDLLSGPGSDTLSGGGGDDSLSSGAGGDIIIGGPGRDTTDSESVPTVTVTDIGMVDGTSNSLAGIEHVTVYASNLGDATGATIDTTMFGGSSGNATLLGGSGRDTFLVFDGDTTDAIDGNGGKDSLEVATGGPAVTLTDASVGVGSESATLVHVEIARLSGSNTPDSLDAAGFSGRVKEVGFDGEDVLIGGSANDTLLGGDGKDKLRGNDGNDLLNGGKGKDSCLGGLGTNQLTACE